MADLSSEGFWRAVIESASPLTDQALDRLEAAWESQNAPTAAELRRERVDSEAIASARLGMPLPVELRRWWTRFPADAALGLHNEALSIARAIETRDMLQRVAAEQEKEESVQPLWRDEWLPWCLQSDGNVLAVDCSVPEGDATPIRSIFWGHGTAYWQPVLPSLGAVVALWTAYVEHGVWIYDAENRHWDRNWDLWHAFPLRGIGAWP